MRHWWIFPTLWALLLAACNAPQSPDSVTPASGTTPTTGRSERVTISFAVWDHERRVYQPLADRFMTEHPDIRVVLASLNDATANEQSDGELNPLNTLRQVVSAADTALSSYWLTPEAFGTPLLLNLKPLMNADAAFRRDDFFPGTIERYTAKGGVWALPLAYETAPLIVYNRTLFQNAGLPEPRPGWTWDDLLTAAERLTERDGQTIRTYGFMDPSGGVLAFLGLLERQRINLLTTSAANTDLTAPEYVAALERVQEWHRTGVLVEPALASDSFAVSQEHPVREGRVAIWSDIDTFRLLDDNGNPWTPDIPIGYAPFPQGPISNFYAPVSMEGLIISGGTSHPEAAWRWIEWLSRQPIAEDGLSGPFQWLPVRQSTAQQMRSWGALDPQIIGAHRWIMEHNGTLARQSFDDAALTALSEAVSAVVDDPKANARDVLAAAQRQLQEELSVRRDRKPTPTPDLHPVVVATPAPQQAPSTPSP